MTGEDLERAVGPVVRVMEGLGVPYFVAGSLASSLHGVPRASIDADLVADLLPEHVTPFCDGLGGAYYVPRDSISRAVEARTSFNVIHLDTMIKVDVFLARRPFDRRAPARASLARIGGPAGPEVRAATPEDTVVAKLEWFRKGGEASERQWTDIVGVLRLAGASLDRSDLEEGASELGVTDLLRRALADATLPPAQRS